MNHTIACNSEITGKVSLSYQHNILASQQSKVCEWHYCLQSHRHVPIELLSNQLEDLRLDLSSASQKYAPRQHIQEYVLPTTTSNLTHKKILDPEIIQRQYKLPTYFNIVQEKFTPGLENLVPKVDPSLHQSTIVKYSMPYMLRIRRHKMKKHKLKKFRKRMIFVHRKLAEIKQRKKERKMLEFQKKWIKLAEDYDPEKFVDDRLALARKGGYGKSLFADKQSR
jgi:hypothetical protein